MVAVATDEKTPLLKQPHYDASPADATPPSSTPSLSDESFGYLLLLGSALGFSFMFFITRLVVGYRSFPVSSVLLIRGAIQSAFALVSIAAFSSFGKSFSLTRSQVAVVALRGAAGGLMLSLNYFALRVLPYGTFASIFFINPIFAMIISTAFLNESAGPIEALAALLSVIGVILVSNPTLNPRAFLSDSPEFALACSAVLLAALVAASIMCLLRKIGSRVDFRVLVLATGFCVGLYGLLLGGADLANLEILRNDPAALAILLVGCCAGFLGACCMNSAFAYCRAATGPLIRNIDVPIAYLMGVVFLGEIPYAVAVAGSALVVAGAGIIGLRKFLAAR